MRCVSAGSRIPTRTSVTSRAARSTESARTATRSACRISPATSISTAVFDDNCLVNVVALGIVKESEIVQSHAPPDADGWDLVLVGKATDPSGFGGASFSSLPLDAEDEEANKGAVQVPDPFLKNVLMRASYRVFALLRERGIAAAFKDLGAGGIMGCSAEMAAGGGYGAEHRISTRSTWPSMGCRRSRLPSARRKSVCCGRFRPHVTADVLRIYNEEFTLPQIALQRARRRSSGG